MGRTFRSESRRKEIPLKRGVYFNRESFFEGEEVTTDTSKKVRTGQVTVRGDISVLVHITGDTSSISNNLFVYLFTTKTPQVDFIKDKVVTWCDKKSDVLANAIYVVLGLSFPVSSSVYRLTPFPRSLSQRLFSVRF